MKNKIHALKFPLDEQMPEKKKTVKYLYIDVDEDHVTLQFHEKRGNLIKTENGRKNNGQIIKMVCIYEGKESETIHGKRKVLTNRHDFCGVNNGEANKKFWNEI